MFIISNTDCFSNKWSMEINPEAIAEYAGKRIKDKYTNEYYVDYPLPTAKKLLKLILQHADDDQILECDTAFVKNPKLFKAWTDLKSKTQPQG